MNSLPIALKLGVLTLGIAAVVSAVLSDGGSGPLVDERTLANVQGETIQIPGPGAEPTDLQPLTEGNDVIRTDSVGALLEPTDTALDLTAPEPEPKAPLVALEPSTPDPDPEQNPEPIAQQTQPGPMPLVSNGFETVGFDVLSGFDYKVSDDFLLVEEGASVTVAGPEIPGRVRSLDGRAVAVTGYMLPLKVVGKDAVEEFLLLRSQALCCYGAVPEVNEWVSVRMPGDPAKSLMDRPVTVKGTLSVGEMREDGYLVGIYEMAGESVEVALTE